VERADGEVRESVQARPLADISAQPKGVSDMVKSHRSLSRKKPRSNWTGFERAIGRRGDYDVAFWEGDRPLYCPAWGTNPKDCIKQVESWAKLFRRKIKVAGTVKVV
jgi:hypothetical protein